MSESHFFHLVLFCIHVAGHKNQSMKVYVRNLPLGFRMWLKRRDVAHIRLTCGLVVPSHLSVTSVAPANLWKSDRNHSPLPFSLVLFICFFSVRAVCSRAENERTKSLCRKVRLPQSARRRLVSIGYVSLPLIYHLTHINFFWVIKSSPKGSGQISKVSTKN